MDPERWQRIEGILDEVLELPSQEISARLAAVCGDDVELRAEVEALLAAERRADGILEGSAAEFASTLLGEVENGAPEVPKLDMEGRQLGPYRILQLIGAGGMGEVYQAHDTRLERSVALKLLPREWSRNPEAKERFLREARTASGLDHPNILNVHELGETEDGQLYLVTAYYPGETLQQKLDRGPLSFGQVRKVAVEVARGLERAHEAGIVHRDIKPSNVMMTDRGEVKILDFGIARIADDVALTKSGTLPGTPAYMSPEQVAGEVLDARSDLWSLGVVLHEMITGRRPFVGEHALVVMRSIVDHEPAPLERPGEDVPEDLRRVVARALAKDPAARFESAAEFLAELHPSSSTQTVVLPGHRRWNIAATMLLLVTFLLALGGWWAWRTASSAPPVDGLQETSVDVAAGEQPASPTATEVSAPRTSLAVLYFENLAGDPSLEWLSGGITDMLVTDLSQSPEIKVLSTSRLYQILLELDALEQRTLSFETLQAVAGKIEAHAVVRGSFARLGKVLRLIFTLENPTDGEILASKHFEGQGEESLFSLVDQLSASIRERFEVGTPRGGAAEVQDITTSSLAAWRLYSEAVTLQNQLRGKEALPLLEQAVELDPEFALALVALGRIHVNLGNAGLASSYIRQAVDLAEHLPVDQRLSITAIHHATSWSTYGRAIEAFREALFLDPEKGAWRNNLANLYAYLERYDEGLAEFDWLTQHGSDFGGTSQTIADIYAAQGQLEKGHRLLEDMAVQHPENWFTHLALAWFLIQEGRLHDVEARLLEAARLSPKNHFVDYVRWRLQVLTGDFDGADRSAQAMLEREDPNMRWRGFVSSARNLLYRGRSQEAIRQLQSAATVVPEPDAYTALAHAWRADLLLSLGDAEQALAAARQARQQAPGTWPEYLGIFVEALASEALGRTAAADALRMELAVRFKQQPNPVEERQLKHLEGRLAFARNDFDGALAALRQAEELLPPRGIEIHDFALPDHLPIWFALGETELAAGRPAAARLWFAKVAESGSEHIMFPLPWVRSFYFLGHLHTALGETDIARRHFDRFLTLWQDSDFDRQQVAEAARR